MSINPVAQNLLAVVRKAPKEGFDLLAAMVPARAVDLQAPVDEEGTHLLAALHHLALAPRGRQVSTQVAHFQSLFSPEVAEYWDDLGMLGQMFAVRYGQSWLPLSVLRTFCSLHDRLDKTSSTRLRKETDAWLCRVLPVLPEDCWQQAGGELLAMVMEMEMPKATDAIWSRMGPFALDTAGNMACLRATRHEHWLRLTKKHPDVLHQDMQGAPLWQRLADAWLLKSSPDKPNGFQLAFENWVVEAHHPDLVRLQAALARSNMSRPRRYTPDQWVGLLRLVDDDWTAWTAQSRADRPAFPSWRQLLLRSRPALPMLLAFEGAPDLIARLPSDHYKHLAQIAICQDISSHRSSPDTDRVEAMLDAIDRGQPLVLSDPGPLEYLVNHVINHGWSRARKPIMAQVNIPVDALDANTALVLSRLASLDSEACWGVGEEADRLADERIKPALLSTKLPSRDVLDAWAILHGDAPTPRLQVATGVARAVRGGEMSELVSVPAAACISLLESEAGRAILASFRNRFARDRRTAFDSWVQAAKMEKDTPTVTRSRTSGARL